MSLRALCTLRSARIGLLLAALSLLSACAMVRLAYNNADTVLRVMAQDYFDLWTEDNTELRQQIARLHEWHRREELPGYANLMQAASAKVAAGIDKADIDWLGPDHHAALAKKMADNNLKFAKEFLGDDPSAREKARVKRVTTYVEDWTGPLSDAQQARITSTARAFPRLSELQLASRQARQQELLSLLRRNRSAAELAPALRAYFLDWESRRGSDYGRMAAEWEAQLTQMLVDLDRTFTPEQRSRAVKRAAQFAEDFRVLAAAKP